MDNKKIARELVKVAKELISKQSDKQNIETLCKHFYVNLETYFDDFQNDVKRLQKMQYIEEGVGGRKEDKEVTKQIDIINHNLEVLDDLIDFVQKSSKKIK